MLCITCGQDLRSKGQADKWHIAQWYVGNQSDKNCATITNEWSYDSQAVRKILAQVNATYTYHAQFKGRCSRHEVKDQDNETNLSLSVCMLLAFITSRTENRPKLSAGRRHGVCFLSDAAWSSVRQ